MRRMKKIYAILLTLCMLLSVIVPQHFIFAEAADIPTDLFFSEYIEGSSYNKAIEIYNGTGEEIDLQGYSVELYSNGNTTPNYSIDLQGAIADKDVYVIAHGSAVEAILGQSDLTSSAVINFNGDDAFVLKNNGVIIDSIGKVGEDPGSYWGTDNITTKDHTLVRKTSIISGDNDPLDDYNPAVEWDSYDIDTFIYLGSHVAELDYSPISEVRGLSMGTEVVVKGIVTFAEKSTAMYIQDATGGIKIDTYGKDVDLSSYVEGDIVKVRGILDSYKEEIEVSLENTSDIELVSSGNQAPNPVEITIAQLEDYQGQLVKLLNAEVIQAPGSYDFLVEDVEGNTTKTYFGTADNFDKSTVNIGDRYNITAIAGTYYNVQLKLRDGADLDKIDNSSNVSPMVYNESPADFASLFDRRPLISAQIEETGTAIDQSSIKLIIDNQLVPHQYDTANMLVYYQSTVDLALGDHDVILEVSDVNGLKTTTAWFFTIEDQNAVYNFYYGVPHSHTAYSDGKGTPSDAFGHARQVGLDFLMVTDHSNWLDGVVDEGFGSNYEYDAATNQYIEKINTEWYKTRVEAEAFNALYNDFLALRGFEMTSSTWGHINVINSPDYVEAKNQMTELHDFYNWLLTEETAVASFNHPNWPSDSFYHFSYIPEADRVVSLIEVGNGAPPYSYVRAEDYYFKALDNGWHVGAINGQDNHSTNWGDPDNLTVVLAEELTKEAFNDALLHRRVYSTETRTLELTVKANGYPMGSVLDVDAGEVIQLNILAEDSTAPIDKVQLITNGGNIIGEKDVSQASSVSWAPQVTATTGSDWFVVKVIHENGKWGTASPIFTPGGDRDVKLSSLEIDPETTTEGQETNIKVTVNNNGIRDENNIELKIYEGSYLIDSVVFNEIKAGEAGEFNTVWTPTQAGEVTITARLTEIPDVTTVTEISKTITIVASNGKRIMIDDSHDNVDVTGTIGNFIDMLRRYGYQVDINTSTITASKLENIDVLVINTPINSSKDFTAAEEEAIGQWVQNGGSVLIAAKSNYNNDSTLMNSLMESIGTNIRFNDDNIYEPEYSDKYSGGMVWSVYAYNLPKTTCGINADMEAVRIFSGCSLVNAQNQALVNNALTGLEIILAGNETSYNAYPGSNAYVYNTYGELNGDKIPIIARENVDHGKVVAAGRHFYSDFEIVNDVSNTALTLKLIDWLADYDRVQTVKTIRETAQQGDRVTVQGRVTVPTETFYDVIYVQDKTGGICLYGNYQDKKTLNEGDVILATGVVKYFEGEMEVVYDNFDYDLLYIGSADPVEPKQLSAAQSMLSTHTGKLVSIQGRVTEINEGESYFLVKDGTGEAYIHVDGYVGADMSILETGYEVKVIGIASVGAAGPRIRVRYSDDIIIIDDTQPSEDDITITIVEKSDGTLAAEVVIKALALEDIVDVIQVDATVSEDVKEYLIKIDSDLLERIANSGIIFEILTNHTLIEIAPEDIELESGKMIEIKTLKLQPEQSKKNKGKNNKGKNKKTESEITAIIVDTNIFKVETDRKEKFNSTDTIKVTLRFFKEQGNGNKKDRLYYYDEEKNQWKNGNGVIK